MRKACSRSQHAIIYTYKERSAAIWWENKSSKLNLLKNLSVISLPSKALEDLDSMLERTIEWQCTIQDGHVWIASSDRTVEFNPIVLKKKKIKDVRHRSILMRRQETRKKTLTAKPLRAQREIYD
jgi:uncharacterized protein YaeQ